MASRRLSMVEGLSPKEESFLKQGIRRTTEDENKQTNNQENKFTELVTFTVRIPREIAASLRKISVDRKINRLVPATQQEIVQAAIEQWLREHQ